jgi:pilus assembly protein CpaF
MFGKRGDQPQVPQGGIRPPHPVNGQSSQSGASYPPMPDLKVQPGAVPPTQAPRAAPPPQAPRTSLPQTIAPTTAKPLAGAPPRRSDNYYDVKTTVFNALIDTIDLTQLAKLDRSGGARGNSRHRRRDHHSSRTS